MAGKSTATGKAKAPYSADKRVRDAVLRAAEVYYASGNGDSLAECLQPRQRRFCEEYVIDFNAVSAYIRAGYKDSEYSSRAVHILMKNPGVQAYIDYLSRERANSVTVIDENYIVSQILSIVSKAEGRDGDKLRGLELLAKIKRLLVDRQEITGKDGEAIEINQRKKEDADAFIQSIRRMAKRDDKVDVELV